MKINFKVFFTAMALLVATQVQAQTEHIIKFFDQYAGEEGLTTVYVTPTMIRLLGSMVGEDEQESQDIKEVMQDLKGIRMLFASKEDGKNVQKMLSESMQFANHHSYEELMIIKDDENDIKFLVKESSDAVIEELLMVIGGEENFGLISLVGRIDLNKISKLSGNVNINGLENLEHLDCDDIRL